MKILLVDNHSKHRDELISILGKNATIETQEQLTDIDTNVFDLIVLSGGSNVPSVLYNPEKYTAEINLIQNTSSAVLGICLGSEIITEAFGGKLQDLKELHRGEILIEITNKNLKKNIKKNPLSVYEAHEVGVKTIPRDFEICAQSSHGPEIIKHKTKPIIGIQFHPEVEQNKLLWNWIFENLK